MTLAETGLRQEPFDILLRLEESVRTARLDITAGQASTWVGLGFRVGKRWFVCPRQEVREVVPPPPSTRVPNSKDWLKGLANFRGNLLALVDLSRILDDVPLAATRSSRVLVLNSDRVPLGLMVDEVVGYRTFVAGDQDPSGTSDPAPLGPWLLGAFQREGQLWKVLSLHKLSASDLLKQAGW